MLVLTRNTYESIILMYPDGTHVRIQVCAVERSGRVQIGVDAPRQVKIVREELLHQKEE